MWELDRMKSLVIICTLWAIAAALPDYKTRIPNGHKVPHPCFVNTIWQGVGHQFHGGGGLLNPFGEDFKANGFKWDKCLCEQDSDGDGVPNGEELGDPNCVWTEGDLPEKIEGLSHPGICEPVESQECQGKNKFDVCLPIEFDCPGIDDEETEIIHLRFNETVVPAQETTYYCMAFQFDETRDLHGFAMEPALDNGTSAELVHHIDMYECTDEDYWDDILRELKYPRECGAMTGCAGNMLAAWAVGVNGICLQEDIGIRIGKYGAKVAIMRIHYHNPLLREGETDESGLSFYVTPEIRQHDAQVLNIGQMYLEIPPGQVEHDEYATMSDLCTNSWKEDIYLVFGTMHMHYLGTGGYSELFEENGDKVRDVMIQELYDYNAPELHSFDPPIHVKRGQTIKHTCRFHSRGRTEVTWRGQAATDEMCHCYFVYYPAQNLTEAFNDGRIETCRYRNGDRTEHPDELGCDKGSFNTAWDQYMGEALRAVCDTEGKVCNEGCPEMLEWAHNNHSCLSGEARTGMYKSKEELRNMQSSCREYPPVVTPPASTIPPEGDCVFGGATQIMASNVLLAVIIMMFVSK